MVLLLLLSRSVMSDSGRPRRWQPTRLSRPWDSPGKNTGVGCHFLLQCRKVKSESKVAQSCLDLRVCSLPGSSINGIFQARVLEWGAIAFSQGRLIHCLQGPGSSIFLLLYSWHINLSSQADCLYNSEMTAETLVVTLKA